MLLMLVYSLWPCGAWSTGVSLHMALPVRRRSSCARLGAGDDRLVLGGGSGGRRETTGVIPVAEDLTGEVMHYHRPAEPQ
jgi:hypothetical protein